MTETYAAHALVARLMSPLAQDALQLAAALLTAAKSAHAILAPIAEEHEAAGVAFQLLADAIADAVPPNALKV